MTTRSHDQYNTTIYGWTTAIAACSACAAWSSSTATTSTCWASRPATTSTSSVWDDGVERRADGFLLVAYDIPRGCIGAYYPETNPLVPLQSVADIAGTPTSKSIPVLLQPAKGGNRMKLRVL
jgi:hypothetical protein